MVGRNRVHGMVAGLVLCFLLTGCASIGPPRAGRDRIEYNLSLSASWKRQILLNIVKIRYVEPLFFMGVGEIVAAYAMETEVSMGASREMFDPSALGSSTKFEIGGSGKYTDRPTITYKPLTGTAFLRGVMFPMPLHNILLGIESGASAAFFLSLGVRAMNGLRNERLTPRGYMPADPDFLRVAELFGMLQAANALHIIKVVQGPDVPPALSLRLGGRNPSPETTAQVAELKKLLDLDPTADKFLITVGHEPADRRAISLQTYSLAQMLATVSSRVDMPVADVESHRATPGLPVAGGPRLFDRILVHSSKSEPKDAFVSIKRKGTWFWVDDCDLVAKRVFSFILLAFTILDDGQQESQLQLTIPTQ